MTNVSRAATFAPGDTLPVILADLACPACGRLDPEALHGHITRNRIRMFCDCCGAFVTTTLSDDQATALNRRTETLAGR